MALFAAAAGIVGVGVDVAGVGGPRATWAERPVLLVPAPPDSAPPESEPAPLLTPDRPDPGDSLLATGPELAREHFQKGLLFERIGQPAAAVAAYRNALRADPFIAEANYRMGMLFLTRSQFAEAAKHFTDELNRRPEHVDAARELGLTWVRGGDAKRGIQRLEELRKGRPKDGRLWHALGFAYASDKRPKEAEAALRKAIALPPPNAEAHRDLGVTLATAGRVREARSEYRKALDLDPEDASTWFNLGNLERRAGRADSALAAFRSAASIDTTLSIAYQSQAQVLMSLGRNAEAAEVYARWLSRRPADHAARAEAVALHTSMGNAEKALEIARDGAEHAGAAGEPHVIYGLVLARQGRLLEGLRQLHRAEAKLRSTNPLEYDRVRTLISTLRASAPDSLKDFISKDSLPPLPAPSSGKR